MCELCNDVERGMRGNAYNPQEKVAGHKSSEIKGRADHRLGDGWRAFLTV